MRFYGIMMVIASVTLYITFVSLAKSITDLNAGMWSMGFLCLGVERIRLTSKKPEPAKSAQA